MKTKLIPVLMALAPLFASAAASGSYNITLTTALRAGGTELKPGDYKVTIAGDKAEFRRGKQVFTAAATLGAGEGKYARTSVLSKDSKIVEIDLGGTSSRITFQADTAGGQ